MQTELNHTVKSLFDRENLDELSREDLHLMTVKYPYSSILQFLYTRKLQSQKDLGYAGSVAKTALYFSNPHWLHHQLRVKSKVENIAEKEKVYQESHSKPVEIIQATVHPVIEQPEDIIIDQTIASVPEPVETALTSSELAEAEQLKIGESADDVIPDQIVNDIIIPESVTEVSSITELETAAEIAPAEITETATPISEAEPENLVMPDMTAAQQVTETTIETDIRPEIQHTDVTEVFEPTTEALEMPPTPAPENEAVSESKTAAAPAETMEIPFEPLYAVDYFASQGIRLREEDQQDQLGKKLKSFTEWLKSMKKIHPEKSRDLFDAKTEASIKSEADQSNDKAEVLTETMAEVLIKQGLTQKAIEVYEKLSLLDPAKSATFAAKISELKAI